MFDALIQTRSALLILAALIAASPIARSADGVSPPAAATVVELLKRDLLGGPDKEVLMLTVSYPAAGTSLPHRHDAQVFVYVLEGTLTMQVRGSPPVTLKAGDTFYEAPDDVHVVSANQSAVAAAKFLVVMIKDKAKPASRAETE